MQLQENGYSRIGSNVNLSFIEARLFKAKSFNTSYANFIRNLFDDLRFLIKENVVKIGSLISFLFFLIVHVQAQSLHGTIRGRISSKSDQGVAEVTVAIEGTSFSTSTKENGDFEFLSVPSGTYTLSINAIGYLVKKQIIEVKGGKTTILNYELNGQTNELSEVSVVTHRFPISKILNKTNILVRDLPVSISSVSLKTIEQRGVDDLNEAMKNTSGVRANNTYGGFQHFTIRGFSNFVLLVDGVRDERHNISTSAPSTNLANVERIEVLKGPASVLFGHSALGGIINIVRKQPSFQTKADFMASYGSFDTRRLRAGVGGPVTNKLRYRIDFGISETDGYRKSETNTNNAYMALEYTPNAKDDFYLTVGLNDDFYSTDTGLPVLTGSVAVPSMNLNTRYNDPSDFLKHRRADFQLRYTREIKSNLHLSNHISYSTDDINYFSTEELTFNPTLDSLKRSFPFYFNHQTKPFQNQLEVAYNFKFAGVEQKFLAGYSLSVLDRKTYNGDILGTAKYASVSVVNPVLNQGDINFTDKRYRATQEVVHGLYLQNWLNVTENLKALVGLRYDIFKGTYFTNQVDEFRNVTVKGIKTPVDVVALTYRAGLVYIPVQPLSIYSSFSTYFKPSRRVSANGETFDPETGYQAEVGSRLVISEKLISTLSVYYMQKNNQVESFPGGVYKRVGSARSKGLDVDIQSYITPGLDLIAGYTFTNAEYLPHEQGEINPVAGKKIIFAPAHMFNIWMNYERIHGVLKGFSVGAGMNSTSKTYTNSSNLFQLAGYSLADVAIGYRIRKMSWRLNVNNVLEETYFNNAIYSNQFYPGQPRNYLLSFKCTL